MGCGRATCSQHQRRQSIVVPCGGWRKAIQAPSWANKSTPVPASSLHPKILCLPQPIPLSTAPTQLSVAQSPAWCHALCCMTRQGHLSNAAKKLPYVLGICSSHMTRNCLCVAEKGVHACRMLPLQLRSRCSYARQYEAHPWTNPDCQHSQHPGWPLWQALKSLSNWVAGPSPH